MKPNFRISQKYNQSSKLARISTESISRASGQLNQIANQLGHQTRRSNAARHVSIQDKLTGLDSQSLKIGAEQLLKLRSTKELPEVDPSLHFTPEQIVYRRKIMIACLLSLMMNQTLTLNVESILPTYVNQTHPSIGTSEVAIILIFLELASLIVSPIVGINLERIGRKNCIIFGFIIMSIATIGLGLTDFIVDDTAYFYVSLVCRGFQGIGDNAVQTACYSVLTLVFSDNREKYLGFGESAAGVGLMAGPVFGGIFYSYFGYFWCFIFFAVCLVCNMVLCLFLLPNSLNKKLLMRNKEEEESSRKSKQKAEVIVKYKWFLKSRRAMFSFVSCSAVCMFISFQTSFLTVVLYKDYGIPSEYHGYILAIPALTYVISAFLVQYVIDKAPRRIFMFITFVFLTISLFLMGPSQIFHIPHYTWIFFLGYGLNGLSQGFLFVPILPEVIEAVYHEHDIIEGEDEYIDGIISDKAAGLYGSFFSCGTIVAPLLGSAIYEDILDDNWFLTCDVFGIACFVYVLIFFFGNVLPDIRKDRKIKEEMDRKRAQSSALVEKVIKLTTIIENEYENAQLGENVTAEKSYYGYVSTMPTEKTESML